MQVQKIKIMNAFAAALIFLVGPTHTSLAQAHEMPLSEIRKGAQLCDLDPQTGHRAVILPAIWTEISEPVVTQSAQTDLIPMAASFNLDGTLAHPASTQERLISAEIEYIKRQIIAYPRTVIQMNSKGEFIGRKWKLDREYLNTQLSKSSVYKWFFVENTNDPWDRIFQEYVEEQRRLKTKISKRINRKNSFSTLPRTVTPDLDWFSDPSMLKVALDVPVSLLIEPTSFSYPTEDEVVADWEAYARRYMSQNAHQIMECDGTKVVERTISSPIGHKTFEDIGVKVPRIETMGKIRRFNIYGTELK